ADVRVCYSQIDALKIAKENPNKNVIFIAVGFETTTPLTAATLKRAKAEGLGNFYILNAHKSVPNTLEVLVNDKDIKLNALILPGHVSTIIGIKPYKFLSEKYKIGGGVTGFEPIDILLAIRSLLLQIRDNKPQIVNAYGRAVKNEGNIVACTTIEEVFKPCDSNWRGLGIIPNSGYELKDEYKCFDAQPKFKVDTSYSLENSACKCGEVLRGKITPKDCPLFDKACNPQNPIGPCMVSSEGSCAAYFKYLR
ncbi:MAG: hydrogenase formation protein HypD, partial [Clostridia bacterium]|nr:hydrogenase formation protein HypD [Clostridia bacterium]